MKSRENPDVTPTKYLCYLHLFPLISFALSRSFSPRRQHYVIALEIVAEISPLQMTSVPLFMNPRHGSRDIRHTSYLGASTGVKTSALRLVRKKSGDASVDRALESGVTEDKRKWHRSRKEATPVAPHHLLLHNTRQMTYPKTV
jgi:hypothetical protein